MNDPHSQHFINALQQGDLQALRQVPKSDLHNHGALGSPFSELQDWYGQPIPSPPERLQDIADMDRYLTTALRPIFLTRKGFEYALAAAFRQAVRDGISLLEMSIDCWFISQYGKNAQLLVDYVKRVHKEIAPDIRFIPQLGLNRGAELTALFEEARACMATGYFRSIDLYGEELIRPPEAFRELYHEAAMAGLQLKAHSGEFGDAASVRRHVEVLNLSEVQHGISVATEPDIMSWLRERDIRLHVCPSSNIILQRVASMDVHPIRILFDHGLRVTVNTDDLMLFGQSVSDEYLNLYRGGLFSAEELDTIRLEGLK